MNLYGGRESGRTWYQHLKTILIDKLGYTQSKYDECVFYKERSIFFVYTDDGIMIDPSPITAQERVQEMATSFEIDVQGDMQEYLGIKVQMKDDKMHMSQPHLIDSILKDLGLLEIDGKSFSKVTTKHLPLLTTRKITSDKDGPPFTYNWNYRAVIGKLNYLEKSTRPDISYVVHQLARYSTKTRQSHGNAVKHLG